MSGTGVNEERSKKRIFPSNRGSALFWAYKKSGKKVLDALTYQECWEILQITQR